MTCQCANPPGRRVFATESPQDCTSQPETTRAFHHFGRRSGRHDIRPSADGLAADRAPNAPGNVQSAVAAVRVPAPSNVQAFQCARLLQLLQEALEESLRRGHITRQAEVRTGRTGLSAHGRQAVTEDG